MVIYVQYVEILEIYRQIRQKLPCNCDNICTICKENYGKKGLQKSEMFSIIILYNQRFNHQERWL